MDAELILTTRRKLGMLYLDHPILFNKLCAATGAIMNRSSSPMDLRKNRLGGRAAVVIWPTRRQQCVRSGMRYLNVAGYATSTSVSMNVPSDWNFGGQWVKGKPCDSFAPIEARILVRPADETFQILEPLMLMAGM